MKLVINRCFGGFGTSKLADDELRKTDCSHVERPAPERHFGYGHDRNFRDCPHLIAVVERLGDKANGDCARLEVVTVPDGVEFEIDEYDGIERVHETHRSWP